MVGALGLYADEAYWLCFGVTKFLQVVFPIVKSEGQNPGSTPPPLRNLMDPPPESDACGLIGGISDSRNRLWDMNTGTRSIQVQFLWKSSRHAIHDVPLWKQSH